jgi:DNA processing protein
MERAELAAWLRLAWSPGVGRPAARRLLAAFGLPQAIYEADDEALAAVIGPAHVALLRAEPEGLAALVDATWRWLQAQPAQRRVATLGDAAYPAALFQTEDPALVLYLEGVVPGAWPRAVSVVGSRNPTPQGRENARQFGRSFAQAGLTVVSGLALGIDTAAHEGALDGAAPGQLATIAVVGTGLDQVYPPQNAALAARIAQRGLLVSEYPLGVPPLSENFPRRNRIIAALGQGTLVVEAAVRSGSLITARQALEQGRDVFAIPGSIHSPQARGCHELLRQGAKLVETAQDVLEELLPPAVPQKKSRATQRVRSEPEAEPSLLEALGFDPVGLDALVARTGIGAAQLQAQLLEYELDGRVARLPGGLFQRLARG